ncbi:tetratricopeptide repeat protein [Sphingomonas sp. AOB5]|uniref:tetratricopeptide repeat protein n=1 Tax=Sphingomonas sp. AOB5 TaxID=3034017 RepID=UPI0023F864BB|nr:tetratricopeptide repeat protein [Sphingomonas sp. AOB5]MDF7774663.1 tetratricopeptide repeat protein [Sphingomonas sp. AOB5]
MAAIQGAPVPARGQDAPPPPAQDPVAARFERCLDLATGDPRAGEAEAIKWRSEGGGHRARQCLGVAYANQERWPSAAGAFEEAAREAEVEKSPKAGDYWAQAGNAWLAAGDPGHARSALDAALVSGNLAGLPLGEAHLDRARARVATGDNEGARSDLDRALIHAAEDPLSWLLSATLARRMGDLPRAKKDIDEALRRSPDDASVQLEAGNIAALRGDEPTARAAWARVLELAPGSPQANAARGALEQFGAER